MPKAKKEDLAKLHFLQGKKAFEQADNKKTIRELQKALPYYETIGEHPIIAEIHRMLGGALFNLGKMIEARNNYKRAYSSFRDFGNKIGMADCFDQIVISFMVQKEYQHALKYQEKALRIRRETPDKRGLARGLKNLAVIVYRLENKAEKPLSYLEEAFEKAKKVKDLQLLLNITLDQMRIYNESGDYKEALKNALFARKISKEFKVHLPESNLLELGEIFLNVGQQSMDEKDYGLALKYLEYAVTIFNSKGDPRSKEAENLIVKVQTFQD
jgi:tetratricopeptide (TPR) repeat protein